MNAQQIAVVSYNTVSFAALWVVVLCWRGYKTDKLRQDIFNLRAELFEFAAGGGVDFNNHSYRRLRSILNSMIRFAHQLSFIRLVTTLVLERWHPILTTSPGYLDELSTDDNVDQAARSKLQQIHYRLMKLVMFQILTTSIAAFPGLLLYFVYSVIKQTLHSRMSNDFAYCKYRLEVHIQLMERQAVETRELELQKRDAAICAQV
jgi:hypothetical protein